MAAVTIDDSTGVIARDLGDGIRELCSRSCNGIDIALIWHRCDDTAMVVVVDHRNGEKFLLEVDEGENALDLYHHPYAYAAYRQIPRGSQALPQEL
jgi:hypothetical protein